MFKRSFWVLFVLFLFSCINTCQAQQRKKVALVLGGGGAKGAAEVGVLKVLEEADIPIDYIVGTSIGAIVGGLYSIGYKAYELDSLFRRQDWLFLLRDQVKRKDKAFPSKEEKDIYALHIPFSIKKKTPLPTGYVMGQNATNLFSNLTIGYHQVDLFTKLPIPFTCVAVDIVTGKEVELSSGSLPMAMRASMSIPGVFAPVEWDKMLLVDGGVLNNFPADVARNMGADIIIGVDLSNGWKNRDKLTSIPALVDQMISIMGKEKYQKNLNIVNLYIHPNLKEYNAASFQSEAIDTMLIRGEQMAREKWKDILALRDIIMDSTLVEAPSKKLNSVRANTFDIRNIVFEGVSKQEEKNLRLEIAIKEQSQIQLKDIDKALSTLQGMDIFSKVEYRLSNSSPYDLIFLLEEKDYKHINIGLRLDTEEMASLLLNTSNQQRISPCHHYALTGRISRNPYLQLDYAYGGFHSAQIGCTYRIRHNDFDIYSHDNKINIPEFSSQFLSVHYARTIFNLQAQIGTSYEFFHYHDHIYYANGQSQRISTDHFINYYVDLLSDTYDRKFFPMSGNKVHFQGTVYTSNGIAYDDDSPFSAISFHAATVLKLASKLYFLPALKGRFVMGKEISYIYRNYAGGSFDSYYLTQQIAWETTPHVYLLDNYFCAVRPALRYQLKKKLYATVLSEYGREWHKFSSLHRGSDLWGVAVRASYDLIFGPIEAQFNYSNLSKSIGFYLNMGFQF